MKHNNTMRFVYLCTIILVTAIPHNTNAESLVDQVTKVCIRQNATPTYITDAQTPVYCRCEATIWAKRGTETQLRSTMTFMTNNHSYLKGEKYSYDDTLGFIVKHSGEVETKCESS